MKNMTCQISPSYGWQSVRPYSACRMKCLTHSFHQIIFSRLTLGTLCPSMLATSKIFCDLWRPGGSKNPMRQFLSVSTLFHAPNSILVLRSTTGIFLLADRIQRHLPTIPNNPDTHEYFHSSVLEQTVIDPTLAEKLKRFPEFVDPMLELEIEMKKNWPFDPTTTEAQKYSSVKTTLSVPQTPTLTRSTSWYDTLSRLPSVFFQTVSTVTQTINVTSSDDRNGLTTIFQSQTSEIDSVVIDSSKTTSITQNTGNLIAGRA